MPPHLFIIPQEVLVLIFQHFYPEDAIRTKRVSKRLYEAIQTWLPYGFYANASRNDPALSVDLLAYEELCVCNISQIDEALAKYPLDVNICIEPLLMRCTASIELYTSKFAYAIDDHTCAECLKGKTCANACYTHLKIGDIADLTLSFYEIEAKYAVCGLERRVEAMRHMLKTGRVFNSLAISHCLAENDHLPADIILKYLDAFVCIPGVCINAADPATGCTALHWFCEECNEEEEKFALVQWLIDHGADPTQKTTSVAWGTVPAGSNAMDILCLQHPNLRGDAGGTAHPVAKRLYDVLIKAASTMNKTCYTDA